MYKLDELASYGSQPSNQCALVHAIHIEFISITITGEDYGSVPDSSQQL